MTASQQTSGVREKYRVDLTREEAPPHVTYPYVIRGYTSGGDYRRCCRALFEWHAETMNAWTMIAAMAVSLSLLLSVLHTEQPSFEDALPFLALTASVVIHAPLSVGFHLFRGINLETYSVWRRLDQIFIFQVSVLVCFGTAYYVFPWWVVLVTTAVAASIAQWGTQEIREMSPHYRRNRQEMVYFIGSIVMCYWFPMAYQSGLDLIAGQVTTAVLYAVATMVALQLGGFVFANGIPEKYFPGVFDIIGSSHQLMHVAAVVAHSLEYGFVLEMYHRRIRDA
eukprot:jgi/Chrzof1/5003/Cz15g08060.t1